MVETDNAAETTESVGRAASRAQDEPVIGLGGGYHTVSGSTDIRVYSIYLKTIVPKD